jgi:hypothetical protein
LWEAVLGLGTALQYGFVDTRQLYKGGCSHEEKERKRLVMEVAVSLETVTFYKGKKSN